MTPSASGRVGVASATLGLDVEVVTQQLDGRLQAQPGFGLFDLGPPGALADLVERPLGACSVGPQLVEPPGAPGPPRSAGGAARPARRGGRRARCGGRRRAGRGGRGRRVRARPRCGCCSASSRRGVGGQAALGVSMRSCRSCARSAQARHAGPRGRGAAPRTALARARPGCGHHRSASAMLACSLATCASSSSMRASRWAQARRSASCDLGVAAWRSGASASARRAVSSWSFAASRCAGHRADAVPRRPLGRRVDGAGAPFGNARQRCASVGPRPGQPP